MIINPPCSPLSIRLQQLMAQLAQDLPRFSQQLGVPESTLTDFLTHPTGANLEFLATVLSKVDGVSAEWLLAGRGTMLRPHAPANTFNELAKNTGVAVATNHGVIFNVTSAECKQQLLMAMTVIEQQQARLEDKDRIIRLLELQLLKS